MTQSTLLTYYRLESGNIPRFRILPDRKGKNVQDYDILPLDVFVKKKNTGSFDVLWEGDFLCIMASNYYREWSVRLNKDVKVFCEGKESIYPKNFEVGTATIDDDSGLEYINVIPAFRRNKIGTQLISCISKNCLQFHVFAGFENNSRYTLTPEGNALINNCIRNGYLSETQAYAHSPTSPPLSNACLILLLYSLNIIGIYAVTY